VHEEIADPVIEMISGAARELVAGDPADLATDVGPVIDAEAFDGHPAAPATLAREAKRPCLDNAKPKMLASGIANLVPRRPLRCRHISDLKQEIFGPVLHIVRWRGDPAVWSSRSTRWVMA
jgi:RHH-type proline utilization regulon transcriptional repressor/proline dehydrogenase/delta 1-pyrroline-5-carboxylate dehydrogenase